MAQRKKLQVVFHLKLYLSNTKTHYDQMTFVFLHKKSSYTRQQRNKRGALCNQIVVKTTWWKNPTNLCIWGSIWDLKGLKNIIWYMGLSMGSMLVDVKFCTGTWVMSGLIMNVSTQVNISHGENMWPAGDPIWGAIYLPINISDGPTYKCKLCKAGL